MTITDRAVPPAGQVVPATTLRVRSCVRWYPAAVAVVLCALWFANLAIVMPIVAALCVAGAVPRRLDLATRFTVAGALVTGALLAEVSVLGLFGLGFNPLMTWLPIGLVAALLTKQAPRAAPRLLAQAVPVLIAVVLAGFLMSSAFVAVGGGASGSDQRIAQMASHEDGASHLAVVDALLTSRGFAYDEAGLAASAQAPYPPAFHVIVTELKTALDHTRGTSAVRGDTADALWFTLILVFAYMCLAAGALTGVASRGLGADAAIANAAASVAVVGSFLWYPFGLFSFFFGPQILALGFVTALLMVLVERGEDAVRARVAFSAILIVLVSWTWFFLTPIAAGIVLLWLLRSRPLLAHRWFIAGAAVLAAVASTVPVYFDLRGVTGDVINVAGGVAIIPSGTPIGVALLAIVTLQCAARMPAASAVRARALMVWSLVGVVAFSVLIGLYQRVTTGGTSYFYGKSLYSVFAIGVPMLIAAIAAVSTQRGRTPGRAWLGFSTFIVALFLLTGMQPWSRTLSAQWLYRDGAAAASSRPAYAKFLSVRSEIPGYVALQWGVSPDPAIDYARSRWLSAINRRTTPEVWDFWIATIHDQSPKRLAAFIGEQHGKVAIFTVRPGLAGELADAGVSPSDMAKIRIYGATGT